MAQTIKGVRVPDPAMEALHRAFVSAPKSSKDECARESFDDHFALLRRLARAAGLDPRDALSWASSGEWRLEREAKDALAWAAKYHRGAPLDLEGFAAYYADTQYRHLERPHALAWGRAAWYRSLAVVAHWEAARIIAASRMASQRAYARRDAKLARQRASVAHGRTEGVA